MSLGRPIDDWWRAPLPARRLASLRIIVGGFAWAYVTLRLGHFSESLDPASFAPVGVTRLLSRPLSNAAVGGLAVAASLLGAAFVAGWRHRLVGPLFAALFTWVASYRASWGTIFHGEALLVLHLWLLALAPAGDAWALSARPAIERIDARRYGWPVRLMCLVTVLGYLVVGVTALRAGGLGWVTGDLLRDLVAHDTVRQSELGAFHSPLAGWLVTRPALLKGLAGFTLLVLLGAPLALFGRRLARAWVVAAVALHWGMLLILAVVHPYPLLGVAFASFLEPDKLLLHLVDRKRAEQRVGATLRMTTP